MKETINSVGIDIGTSTTQLIFSKLTIENLASSYTVPRIKIVDTEVVYKSPIFFTPLVDKETIDASAVEKIVREEYEKADMSTDDIKTGAVIITGETARKENANDVISALSSMAGDFVVATAGPDLESVLSAKGAGADVMSEEGRSTIANVDIGGGTSNIAVFRRGELVGTSCLDVGGRLVKIENGTITYVYRKTEELAKQLGYEIRVGERADPVKLRRVCDLMAKHLAMALGLIPKDSFHKSLYTNEGNSLEAGFTLDGITFSGGVADIYYNDLEVENFEYGDIGPILGRALKESPEFMRTKVYRSKETIRATVVGAGTHTTEVSGSTIRYERDFLPIQNVPVVRIDETSEEDLSIFSKVLSEKIEIFSNRNINECVAIAFSGEKYTSFDAIQNLANAVISGIKSYDNPQIPIIVIVEKDIGKVLGNALSVLLAEQNRKVICIDSIFVKDGDYIDIGEPVANGRVVPVITKTLIFNH